MKKYIIILFMPLVAFSHYTFEKVDLNEVAGNLNVHLIEYGEVTVNDLFLRRVTIGDGNAAVTFLNRHDSYKKPNYKYEVYNSYGMQIGKFSVFWWLDTLAPGETRSHNTNFKYPNWSEILKFSSFRAPHDVNKPTYLIITGAAE